MDWLAAAAGHRPDAPALITPERTISWAELDRAADGVASIVCGSGLEGGAVALWGERHPATVAALWGISRARATVVPVDPRLPPAEAMHLTREAGARGLWAHPEGGFDRLLSRPAFDSPGWGPPHPDARLVLFTSGTEGRHKGVVLSGDNVGASVAGSRDRLGNGPDDAWLAVLPLFHVGGLAILWRQAEQAAPTVLEERFDPARVGAMLGEVAFVSLVPTMLRRVLEAGSAPGAAALVGGGPADPGLLRRALDAGIPPLQTYGMTETTSQVCTVAPGEAEADLGTAGRPIPGAEVRVVARGEPVVGAEGRIEVRGPMVSPGYLGEEARPADSWFATGDLGSIDEMGRLTVMGRADSLIVTGGENVHPAMVEQALRAHPGVADARVFGVPDEEWGRRVVAEVILAGAGLDEVRRWAERNLSPAQRPKEWRAVPAVSEPRAKSQDP